MSISTRKRLLAALIAIVFTVATAKAQAPQKMSFQSVVRNSSGVLVANHSVGLRLSILQGSINGTAVYVETQTATSNANGLVTLQIGGGTVVSGTFSSIDWSAGPYYIKSELDPTGGTTYGVVGTTQLLSVAYALYANGAGSATTTVNGGHLKMYDSAGTFNWTVPNGVYKILVEAVAGGGGGGGGSNYTTQVVDVPGGGGGGASGQFQKSIINVTPGMVINCIVGSGGAGGGAEVVGSNGGNTSFGTFILLTGGNGGQTPDASGVYGASGGSANGNSNAGSSGASGNGSGLGTGGNGAMTFGGATGGIGGNGSQIGSIGTSGSGGGGGCGCGSYSGGNGGDGYIIISY